MDYGSRIAEGRVMEDYSIESLSKKFKEHAETYEKEWLEHNQKHGFEHFNISKALQKICEHIMDLQKED